MKKAGITPEVKDFDDLDENAYKMYLRMLSKKNKKKYLDDFYAGKSQKTNWIFNTTEMGTWGTDYKKRAYWGVWGLGANLTQDAVYGVTQLDDDLKQLDGENTYRIHFDKGKTPKVGGFWSITAYDNEGYLEENAVNRYATGSNMNMKYNPDGSLDIYLSHKKPKGVANFNWVPTPKEEFKILFRMYWPKKYILEGKYKLPKLVKIRDKK